jgi:hypothetical protein
MVEAPPASHVRVLAAVAAGAAVIAAATAPVANKGAISLAIMVFSVFRDVLVAQVFC